MALADIKSLTLEEMTPLLLELGLKKFQAKEVYRWLHQKQVCSFEEMTNISKEMRQKLGEHFYINFLKITKKLVSSIDDTIKYLYELRDGQMVESVFMRYKHGNSLCISTQAGCRMGCKFCASTLMGLARNLTPAEMLDEIYTAQRDTGEKVDSVVLMGIGEPLDNFENVLKFLRILSGPDGMNMSLRHVSLSTCGIVPMIDALAKENLQLTLSISLHAPNNSIRNELMPVNHKWDIDALLAACDRYFSMTGRRISYEYALVGGVNDTPAAARELGKRLGGKNCHVNLIPVNAVKERGFTKGSKESIQQFARILAGYGVTTTVRRELGSDINAACGQLRRQQGQEGES
ncbi:23S rRNA (adenine(2503)-C(2))-methyltransferase RlmN [Zongyangia hominis]|uniref:Probable dual-specificity RNA methyltransferase RlmN n=1 Tax=Zongyangia hominis TaxID=2763677 RepID=A0A926EFT9_9FIRM|nr:23S rRNA (adenine(2503)-C(2))-methyltransferase RlmN [Zongyangia hominis]MBC8570912.1 23S rRNA (adenine(2503)-C(2))-methyltransferase RlmN [Zongyangia hominis]